MENVLLMNWGFVPVNASRYAVMVISAFFDDECGEKGKCTWVHPQGRPWESVKRCKCKEECIEGTKCMFNEQCGENGICDRKYSFIYSKVGYCTCKTVKPPKVCFDHKMCMKDEDCG